MLLAEKRHTFCWFQGAILNRANMSRQLVSTRLQENCCLTSNFAQRYVLGEYERTPLVHSTAIAMTSPLPFLR